MVFYLGCMHSNQVSGGGGVGWGDNLLPKMVPAHGVRVTFDVNANYTKVEEECLSIVKN